MYTDPFEEDLVGLDASAVGDEHARAVDNGVAFFLAALVVEDGEDTVAVHGSDKPGTRESLRYNVNKGPPMHGLAASVYVDERNGGYYVAGTRVSLASVVYAFRRGESPEMILQQFPSIGALARVYGAITFVLENPTAVESYLADEDRLWEKIVKESPYTEEELQRFRSVWIELSKESA